MSEWQPIETAPKDGTEVLLCRGEMVIVGAWRDGLYGEPRQGSVHWRARCCGRHISATRWQPLPRAAGEGGNG